MYSMKRTNLKLLDYPLKVTGRDELVKSMIIDQILACAPQSGDLLQAQSAAM